MSYGVKILKNYTMPASIGVNLRVTGYSSQGGRKYMEDFFSVAYQQSKDSKDLEFAFIGIYDGHGGSEAATFAKEHLINLIVSQKLFWSENDDDILRAIRNGYIATHWAMWREQDKWPKTASGLPSTAGTTASIAFIRHGKIYIGHAGDSGIVLGYTDDNDKTWKCKPLTQEHKPESSVEKERITNSGGKVIVKSGVPRVVWNRPRLGHKGPVRRSTPIDEIPFLAVARSLGDLWSYNSALNEFVVSPEPDIRVFKIDPKKHRCLVFGTDGLWNVLSPCRTIELVRYAEQVNDRTAAIGEEKDWINPSKCLVDKALERWSKTKMRADNTSVVILMLDPPGPPGRPKRDNLSMCADEVRVAPVDSPRESENKNFTMFDHSTKAIVDLESTPLPTNGLQNLVKYEHLHGIDFTGEITKQPDYVSTESACSSDISYNSFAESYNSLLNSSTYNDHNTYSPYPTTHMHDSHLNFDDTYSLTKLETRSEQFGMKNVYNEPSTSALYRTYEESRLDQQQFDCISSSHLQQSASVIERATEEPASSSSLAIEANMMFENIVETTTSILNETITEPKEIWSMDQSSFVLPAAVAAAAVVMPTVSTPIPVDTSLCNSVDTNASSNTKDEKIQINEISSSSNETKPCKLCDCDHMHNMSMIKQQGYGCRSTEALTVDKIEKQITKPCQRVTRSQHNSLLNITTSTKIRKTNGKRKTFRTIKSKMLSLITRKKLIRSGIDSISPSKVQIQNENLTMSVQQRRSKVTTTATPNNINNSIDISKRTLRSRNSLAGNSSCSKLIPESRSTKKAGTNLCRLASKLKFKSGSLNISNHTTRSNNNNQTKLNSSTKIQIQKSSVKSITRRSMPSRSMVRRLTATGLSKPGTVTAGRQKGNNRNQRK